MNNTNSNLMMSVSTATRSNVFTPSSVYNPTIQEGLATRKNNFDVIRFIAASLVLFSHSFPLSGNNGFEPFEIASNSQWSFGGLGVAVFFVISGFLISMSYDRSNNPVSFFKARALRLFPGLISVIILSTFVLGPLVSSLGLKQYFSDRLTIEYLKTVFLFPIKWSLPGVFTGNAFGDTVNGSLWTLPFELLSYSIVAIMGILGLLRHKKAVVGLFVLTMYCYLFRSAISPTGGEHIFGLQISSLEELFMYFAAGMVLYSFRKEIKLDKNYAMLSVLVLFFALFFGGVKELFVVFGSYLIIYFAFAYSGKLSGFSKYGDFSYGIYLYAFPVQQLVTWLNGGHMNSYLNFAISFVGTFCLSVISWHLVEKNFLKLKQKNFLWPYLTKLFGKYTLIVRSSVSLARAWKFTLDFISKTGWKLFLVLFVLFAFGFTKYMEKPTVVTFPYHKSQSIFNGNWQPQSNDEKYRWIAGSAGILMSRSPGDKELIIEGYVPDSFVTVHELTVYLNDEKISTFDITRGVGFTDRCNIDQKTLGSSKIVNVRLEFDGVNKPGKDNPDQRQLSGLIGKISIQ